MLDKLINTALLKTFGENTIVPLKGAVESVVKDLATEEKSPSVKAHAVGELIMYGSVLYKVINAVAVGDVLDPGNNIELTTVSQELKNGGSGIVVDDEMSNVSENPVQNKIITSALSGKVDKVAGKGLSSNDYTMEEKNKLASLDDYTAGSGISIENHVISATGSGGGLQYIDLTHKLTPLFVNGVKIINASDTDTSINIHNVAVSSDIPNWDYMRVKLQNDGSTQWSIAPNSNVCVSIKIAQSDIESLGINIENYSKIKVESWSPNYGNIPLESIAVYNAFISWGYTETQPSNIYLNIPFGNIGNSALSGGSMDIANIRMYLLV